MNFDLFQGIPARHNVTPVKYNADWVIFRDLWNAHDSGRKSWTNLSFGTALITVTANYSITAQDSVVLVDCTAAIRTITLPTAVGIKGRQYTVKDWKGQCATNNITTATTASQTIDGASTKVSNVAYVSYTFTSDGSNWAII